MLLADQITKALNHQSPGRRLAIMARAEGRSETAAGVVETSWHSFTSSPSGTQAELDALNYFEGAYAAASGSPVDAAAVVGAIKTQYTTIPASD